MQSSYLRLDNIHTKAFGDVADRTWSEIRERDDDALCPTLSLHQRLIGFSVCLGSGMLCSIFAWVTIFMGDLNTFAVINTVANILSIGSTFFLCGPLKQLRSMLVSYRWAATTIYFVSMILTFVFALAVKIPALTIVTVIIQYFAMLWYALSYIPFARDAVLGCLGMKA